MPRRRTALLFQDGNFVGREYFHRLVCNGRAPDLVLAVGTMSAASVARENERTGGLWNPAPVPGFARGGKFADIRDPAIWSLVREMEIDVVIQGGIGILKPDMLSAARLGFINVHPGRLPGYRGNACPEWAVLRGDPVYATAHFIDIGIDTGPVICEAKYEYPAGCGYPAFRAGLYAHCASVLLAALDLLDAHPEAAVSACSTPQPVDGAHYHPAMTTPDLDRVRALLAMRPADAEECGRA